VSREGTVYRRCTRCGAKMEARRCRCGHEVGRWTFICDVTPRDGKLRQQRTRGGFPSKSAALEAMHELQSSDATGSMVEPRKLTLGQFLTDWLGAVKREVRSGTLVNYQHAVKVISARLGAIPLQALNRQHVKALYTELAESGNLRDGGGLSAKSVHNTHLCLHRALRDAVEDRLIASNPADRAHRLPKARTEMKVWKRTQVATFLEAQRGDRLYAAFRLALTTGLRRGELLALRWADVALDNGTLSVSRAYVRGMDGLAYGEPKTNAGRRVVDLDPETVSALRAHRRAQLEERLRWGPAYEDGDLLFARENGTPMDPDGLSGTFERRAAKLGLPRIRFHDMRHTHATLGLEAGIPPKVMQERLGHSSITMTLDLYSHVVPGMQKDAATRIAALIDATG